MAFVAFNASELFKMIVPLNSLKLHSLLWLYMYQTAAETIDSMMLEDGEGDLNSSLSF